MPKEKTNYVEIYYNDEGSGETVLLLHGLSDSADIWQIIKGDLIRDYRVILMDLRGHGRSDKPETPYSIRKFSNDVENLLNALNVEKVYIVGFSLGGVVAQQFALNNPEKVISLILLSTFSYVDRDLEKKFRTLRDKLLHGGCGVFYDEVIKLVLTPQFLNKYESELDAGKKLCLEMNSAYALIKIIDALIRFNLKNEIKSISQPTLIISGKNDIFTPPHFSRQLHNSIINSQLKIVDNVGHNLLVPENIPYLADLILNFLNSIK
jgi:3-oxoadipate enol-lactonase